MMTKDGESQVSDRHSLASLESNKLLLTVDGLFAGFAFTGALQLLALPKVGHLHIAALICLILATILFAFRISIAIRLIWSLQARGSGKKLEDSASAMMLLRLGRVIESFAILLFWLSLIPLSFHAGFWLGIFTSSCIFVAFVGYAVLISFWKKANQELGSSF